ASLIVFSANTFANSTSTQTLEIGGTKVVFTLNKGTQATPELGIAYKEDVTDPHTPPDIYWEANEKSIISGTTQNNVQNASVDQFLKSGGNTMKFRVLVNDGTQGGQLIPTIVRSNHIDTLAPAFDLSKGKTKNCTVSYIPSPYGAPGYWTSSCSV
ncbi:hypothetical protein OAO18_06415, partial [Francisellaceae bacterium]|nr:hypothetical protein [Francisellaceae bacterium]